MITRRLILPLVAALSLSACLSSVLPDPKPAESIYRLGSPGDAVLSSEDAVVMRIDRPIAPTALLGTGIVVSPEGNRLATADMARWADPIPALVQASFYEYLSTRPKIEGILPASGARTAYRSSLTIRNFEAEFDNGVDSAPLAVVHYTATVADASSRKLIGTYTVKKTARASSPNVSAIVKAQDEANKEALAAIADWIESLNLKS